MPSTTCLIRTLLLTLGLASTPPLACAADDYPARPIRMVVGFAAGGATDLFARIIGQKLADRLGQQVNVDNRTGAGGSLGTDIVAKAPPDGYTLLMVSASHAINLSLYKSLPFDPVADFDPICTAVATSNVLAVHPSLPASTLAEFLALARAKPGGINLASAGTGSSSHLAGELFKSMAGITLVHVPYKGTADALRDLLSGQVQATVDALPALLPHINRGTLRALGVGDARRIALLPNVPTIAEGGVPGYEVFAWTGVVAPAKTPRPVIDKL
ncbi:MAG: tripartite tricarboxylate transporter substrate binding protein, partial [Burkholderiales bacterium]|nr:tripartite tricarboxylate transporter substrate binding protein [Burkholderiales bacterium]